MAMTPAGSSVITIGPDTPPAWTMCVIFSRTIKSRRPARSERSSMTCVVAAGRGSRPMAFFPVAARRDMITRPTKPLDPVTSVTNSLMVSDHAARAKPGNRLRVVAEARHDLVGMLTKPRCGAIFRLRRPGKVDRLADDFDVTELGMPHRLCDVEVLHLRLGECLVDGIDRAARDARVVQQLHPMRARFRFGDPTDPLVERLAVVRAQFARGMRRIVQQIPRAGGLAEARPQQIARGRDVDVTIGGRKH